MRGKGLVIALLGASLVILAGCTNWTAPNTTQPETPQPPECVRSEVFDTQVNVTVQLPVGPITNVSVSSDQCADLVSVHIQGILKPAYRAEYVYLDDGIDDPATILLDIGAPNLLFAHPDMLLQADGVVRGWKSVRQVRFVDSSPARTTLAISTGQRQSFAIQSHVENGNTVLVVTIHHV